MRHAVPSALALLALAAPAAAHVIAPPARPHPVAAAGSPREVERAFLDAAARSYHPRAGDLFTLPEAYNSLVEPPYLIPEVSRVPGRGRVKHLGNWHSGMWHYDSRIPLILYGPGRVRAGVRPRTAATQQDLPATWAWAMHTTPPRDCGGRVLAEAFARRPDRPRAILTIVIDQGGRALLDAHPAAWPAIARLRAAGADFPLAEVTHLEAETALGHVAIGTGAWPDRSGIPSNYFYHGGAGTEVYGFDVETRHAPQFLESPTLGDHWLRATGGKAILAAHSQSDRAAIGMGGHGAFFEGNPKPIVSWFDSKTGRLATHERYYRLPGYMAELAATPYREAMLDGAGKWLDHLIPDAEEAKRTPALVKLEGDAIARLLTREPIGQDDVTDLVYVSFKGTDYAGHRYGYESEEARDVLRAVDTQVDRLVRLLEARVGQGRFLVAVTADHGSTPLPELSGGTRLNDVDLLAALNRRYPTGNPRVPVALYATSGEIWLDRAALASQGKTPADVAAYLRAYRVNGKRFYRLVVDRPTVAQRRAALGLAGR